MTTDLQWTTEKRKVSDLIGWDKNPRKLSDEQKKLLEASINKFNLVEIPAVNLDNKIVAGHQRVTILGILGRKDEMIDVRVPNRQLTDEEFAEYNVRSNKNVGDWDWGLLSELDRDMLLDVGFLENELLTELGLENANDEIVEDERLEALQVFPPETPRLKDRAAVHFNSYADYAKVKKAIADGKINSKMILDLC